MATTVLKMPPAVPAVSSTSGSENLIGSQDDALTRGAAPAYAPRGRVIRVAPLASRHVRGAEARHPVRPPRTRLQLLAGRQGQLRRRPGSRRAGTRRQPGG